MNSGSLFSCNRNSANQLIQRKAVIDYWKYCLQIIDEKKSKTHLNMLVVVVAIIVEHLFGVDKNKRM